MGTEDVEAKQPIGMDLQKMNNELLDILRVLANPAKCKPPEPFRCQDDDGGGVWFSDGECCTGKIITHGTSPNNVMDLLGRLSRAIEKAGWGWFDRVGAEKWTFLASDNVNGCTWEYEDTDVASEALALAKCIRAAVEKAVKG